MKARYAVAAALALLAITVPTGLDSCSVSAPGPVFATSQRPADLWGQFLKGRIGVLQRSYREKYLIAAFRILSETPLTEEEAAALFIDLPAGGADMYRPSAAEGWLATRQHVQGLPAMARIEPYKTVNLKGLQYSFLNCQANAFEKAVETLSSLGADWGFDNPKTLEWATAQDQVFANCSATEAAIPTPPREGMDPVLAAHRRYQIAAAYFYAGDLRRAAQSFQEIAEEKDSPWREIAPYLAARALLRAGLLNGDREAFREGMERTQAILDDPRQSDWHEPSRKLLEVWRLRAEPEVRLKELGSALVKPRKEDIRQSVIDFLYLVDGHPEIAEAEDADELAAWVVTMTGHSALSAEVATKWWRRRQNPAWLIPALATAKVEDSRELMQAAAKIPPGSPAYESVAYYAIRLAKRAGHREEARRFADRALNHELLHSSRNWILAERFDLARDWNEFLRFSLRRPEPNVVEYDGSEAEEETPGPAKDAPVFDSDALHQFDAHLPLTLWVDASRNKALPPHMQARIAVSGWMRAVLLGRSEEARSLMQRVVELQPGAAEVAKGFLDAREPGEARFASVYVSLWAPTVCPYLPGVWDLPVNLASPRARFGDRDGRRQSCWYPHRNDFNPRQPHPEDTGFLTAKQRVAGAQEAAQIESAPPWQATYLLKETITWARAHADDPRVPRALHMAVAASRYRGTDADTGKYSKQAFDLLHRRYPKSEWNARTSYWYK